MGVKDSWQNPWAAGEEVMGIITGSFALVKLPNIKGEMFRLKANGENTGSIYIGTVNSTGSFPVLPWEFCPGYDSGWFSSDSLERYYMAGSSGSCYLSYWVFGG